MPLVRNVISGAKIYASAKVARKFNITVTQGTTSVFTAAELQTNTLPACVWYCVMTAGPANCTFNPLFAVDNRPGGAGIEPDYLAVTVPVAVVVNTPILITERLSCNMICGTFTVPGGGANATISIVLAASL